MAVKLNFREKGIPKTVRNRLYILILIFIAALCFFQIVLNRKDALNTIYMADAKLPLVTVEKNDMTIARLHGYVNEMDACYMRDALIPLDKNRKLHLSIDKSGFDVRDVSYEIRSLDTERKIADTQLTDWSEKNDAMSTTVQVENLIEEDEEYLFVLQLNTSENPVYYYTRIMLPSNHYETACIDFAKNFHDTALSGHYDSLAAYVETSPYADTETLSYVTIESTLDQIGWKNFNGVPVGKPCIQITDMNEDYVSMIFYYQMKESDSGLHKYYDVEEYFKIRYTEEQTYLLDYQRSMAQYLDESGFSVKDNIASIGVADSNLEYLSNETGTIVSFVQLGELYQYNQNKQHFTKVFGFIDDPENIRQTYRQHNIRILNIDENGNMDFVVYGYMNRGEHEGECGINLYHYDSAKQQAVEQIFISSTHSYQILNANFSNLLYENENGDFYIMLGGTLAKVGLHDLSTVELITGLSSDQYAVSQSGRYVAWIEDGKMGKTMFVMDLETEKTRSIDADSGMMLRPLAFMTEDLVYGVASEHDITKDAAGSNIYPMSSVYIVDTSSENFDVLKEYQKSGYYVTEAMKDSYTLYLSRVVKRDGIYVAADEDTIKDSAGEQNKTVALQKNAAKNKGYLSQFLMAELDEGNSISSISGDSAVLVATKQTRSMSVSASEQEETYFVYVGNHVVLTTQNLTKAIANADAELGIVVDNRQRYIWKRGKRVYVNAFQDIEAGRSDAASNTSAGCISALLAREGENTEVNELLQRGETPISVLQKSLKDCLVVDLSGCTLPQVLYYVSQGSPVYARTGVNDAMLIIGYDAANIIVYHSDTDRYAKMSSEAAAKLFEDAGNVYISYVK